MIFKGNIELKQNDFKSEKELQKYFENNLGNIFQKKITYAIIIMNF